MKIEINDEFASKIVAEDLKWHINNFKKDIKKAKAGESYLKCFSMSPDEDIKRMKEMMNAMKLVLTYYTVPSDE